MSDRIRLRGLSASGRHGVLPVEKERAQPFLVDVDLDVDLSWAGASDDLADTVDYAALAADVHAVVAGPTVDLVETLATRVADVCLARPAVEAAEVTVHKPEAPVGLPVGDVAVTIRRERSRPVVVALGANLGRPDRALAAAVRAIAAIPGVTVRSVSGLVDTDPVGGPDQPAYLNAVLLARTRLHPRTLLSALAAIEADHGRTREVRWGPRTLDLDIVQVGDPADDTDLRAAAPDLLLPHPRAHERAFVLVPWLQVDPVAELRVGERVVPVAELAAALPTDGVRPGPAWDPAW